MSANGQVTSGGLIVVAKPGDVTSHDVVARVRRIMRTRRVGHAGTLDPMATGVLVIGVDRATKLLGHLTLTTKDYLATIRLGRSTVTDDAMGEVTGGSAADGLALADIESAIATLTGAIMQVPSAVSAVKVQGKRAYARVRAGEQVALESRPVTVAKFEILGKPRPGGGLLDLDVEVGCSSGTYVRALARDLGTELGVGGHLTALRRTRVGPFTVAEAVTLDELADRVADADAGISVDDVPPVPIPLAAAVERCFARRDVDDATAGLVRHGRPLVAAGLDGTYGVFGPDGGVLALMVDVGDHAKPVVVLDPA